MAAPWRPYPAPGPAPGGLLGVALGGSRGNASATRGPAGQPAHAPAASSRRQPRARRPSLRCSASTEFIPIKSWLPRAQTTRKVCRAQQRAITKSRTPCFHRRSRSCPMRQRFDAPVDRPPAGAAAGAGPRQPVAAPSVSSVPRGCFVGMGSRPGERQREAAQICNNPLPAGRRGVASALRLSGTRPPEDR